MTWVRVTRSVSIPVLLIPSVEHFDPWWWLQFLQVSTPNSFSFGSSLTSKHLQYLGVAPLVQYRRYQIRTTPGFQTTPKSQGGGVIWPFEQSFSWAAVFNYL